MAEFWASKNPLPSASAAQQASPEYGRLLELKELAGGLSLAQGQADIYGAIEMIGALHYHYLQFIRARERKISGEIDVEAPDDRFEAVAYINRIGQLYYFSMSPFVAKHVGEGGSKAIPSVSELVLFRHKYTAHRARDVPKRNSGEENDINGEIVLGSLGGEYGIEREPGGYSRIPSDLDWKERRRREIEQSYTFYYLFDENGQIEFNLERDHPRRMEELCNFLRELIALTR